MGGGSFRKMKQTKLVSNIISADTNICMNWQKKKNCDREFMYELASTEKKNCDREFMYELANSFCSNDIVSQIGDSKHNTMKTIETEPFSKKTEIVSYLGKKNLSIDR